MEDLEYFKISNRIHLKISNQISRILFRLIKIPAVIVKTASRKPKKLVIVGIRKLNEICSFYTYLYKALS